MLPRKQGPPVPPRPSVLANRANDRDESSTPPLVNGRTIIYKSPSYDLSRIYSKKSDDIHENSNDSHHHHHYKSSGGGFITNNHQTFRIMNNSLSTDCDIETEKTEIVIINNSNINNNNNNSNNPNKTFTIPSHAQKSTLNTTRSEPCVLKQTTVSPPSNSTASITIKSKSPSSHQNIIEINRTPATHCSNSDVVTINSASQSPPLPINQIEIKNNNLNSMKTEIFINNHVTSDVESPPRSPIQLSHRPEPEGGEILINEMNNNMLPNSFSILKSSKSMSSVHSGGGNGGGGSTDKKVAFHELLISELTEMRRKEEKHEENHRNFIKLSNSIETSPNGTQRTRIRTSDWVTMGDNGKEVVLSSCQISLEDSGLEDEERIDDVSSGVGDSWDSVKDTDDRSRMSLPGLPPLPKSLSGIELAGLHHLQNSIPTFGSSNESLRGLSPIPQRMPTTLDTQLAILRREMFGLRQLDLSLLSQLWALNESIQEFRTMLQEQETLSPPSPSSTQSDVASVSSDDDDDDVMSLETPISSRMRQAPPPPPPTRKTASRPV